MSENIKKSTNEIILPCIATRGIVGFPGMRFQFDIGRNISKNAIKASIDTNQKVFITSQINGIEADPQQSGVFSTGVVADIVQVAEDKSGIMHIVVECTDKATIMNLNGGGNYIECRVKKNRTYANERLDDEELLAISREIIEALQEYSEINESFDEELIVKLKLINDPKKIFEMVLFNFRISIDAKQHILELPTLGEKMIFLVGEINNETKIAEVSKEIHEKVRTELDNRQKEVILQQHLEAIKHEIGMLHGQNADSDSEFPEDLFDDEPEEDEGYIAKIKKLGLPKESEKKLLEECKHLEQMPFGSQEGATIRTYLDTTLSLPWNKKTKDNLNIKSARNILDKDHYGMEKVKERIVENFAVRKLNKDVKGQIICLYGPPGVGKTSVAKSIARALNRKYVRVSLGGIRDESEIRGHRKTYVASMPGRIINAVKQAQSKNPVILLDEIDKISGDFKGDPSAALLEVLDSEQNKEFRDHYIEVPFDLSDVMFITTANNLEPISPPLRDRMEIIELNSYTREEKFHIAKNHLIPKQMENNGLNKKMMRISKDGIYTLIDYYTREAGVRTLERTIASLCRKAAREIVESDEPENTKVSFTDKNIEKYLGTKKYLPENLDKTDEVGQVNGLAWTSVGGVIMPLEVITMEGSGKIELTGSLGDVMKESAKIAVSLCRSMCEKYNIDKEFYKKLDLHIHAPEGAVPKDGPSAGVTMTTAIVSTLIGRAVRHDVAMTGEITLRGKVLPIGGLREKTMAAYKEGMKTVVIPYGNKGDLEEIDEVVKNSVKFVFAKRIEDVLEVALCPVKD